MTPTVTTDPAPAAAGGTIANGTYVLTSETLHGESHFPPGTFDAQKVTSTLEVTGAVLQDVSKDTMATVKRSTNTVAVTGTSLTLTQTCSFPAKDGGASAAKATPFTANATTLSLFVALAPVATLLPAGGTFEIVYTKK